jgi:hypothetical protein
MPARRGWAAGSARSEEVVGAVVIRGPSIKRLNGQIFSRLSVDSINLHNLSIFSIP